VQPAAASTARSDAHRNDLLRPRLVGRADLIREPIDAAGKEAQLPIRFEPALRLPEQSEPPGSEGTGHRLAVHCAQAPIRLKSHGQRA
jgi:hypothetical protein